MNAFVRTPAMNIAPAPDIHAIPLPATLLAKPGVTTTRGSAAFLWDRLREYLEDERYRISREIGSYPAPIPACDQDFNHLLAEREQVNEELARLEQLAARSLAAADPFAAIDRFIRSSPCIRPVPGERPLAG